ncbi:hypothetical protein [Streptomyces liangshanensis]|uniref:hypothetical protein n=1 Tax=Streptomyces liangshanensis TaxID=2717324 RepID=UPI0036DD7588
MEIDPAGLAADAIAGIRDRLDLLDPARGALTSDVEAARHGDPEFAIDDACEVLRYFHVPVRLDEFQALRSIATHFAMEDSLEEIIVI